MATDNDRPTFTIKIEGNTLPATFEVTELSSNKELNRIPSATLTLEDGDVSMQNFITSESEEITPGKKIEIKLGYNGKEETVFKGMIVSLGIFLSGDGTSKLKVEARDESFKMTLNRKNKLFPDKKDSDIVKEIIGDYSGLSADVAASTVTHAEMLQYHATDWDFLLTRMESNGLLVNVDDGKISIGKEKFSGKSALTLTYGNDIFEMDTTVDARYQLKGVTTQTWDYSKQKEIEVKSSEPSLNTQGDLQAKAQCKVHGQDNAISKITGKAADRELKAWADAQLQRSRMSLIKGSVKCQGTTQIATTKLLELKGLGKHFNGVAFVTGVQHRFENNDWKTVIQFGSDPVYFYESSPVSDTPKTATPLPLINGLHIGIVTKLSGDPDKEDRIQVHLPLIHAANEGVWSRVACLDAGKERGSFFRPELKDEVIVGFLDNDPRHMIVLGMLNSSAKPAPVTPKDDKNHIKGFYTRSKMEISFDDEKKIMTLSTPAGNSIVMDEDQKSITCLDQNKNKFCMNKDGIQIESCKDLSIKVKKDIKTSAGGKIDNDAKGNIANSSKGNIQHKASKNLTCDAMAIKLKAKTDCKIDALNINAAAKVQAVVKGNAGLEVSTSGIAIVKGTLVKIN